MYKDTTYKEKFELLKDWMPNVFEQVKKDLKNEHLKQDPVFVKAYFPGKQPQKISTEELLAGYTQAMNQAANAESIGEYIVNRWLLRHGEIYHFFEESLQKINPNFTELTEMSEKDSLTVMNKSIEQFGAPDTYLFSVMNSVVFPPEVYNQLQKLAKQEVHHKKEKQAQDMERKSHEDLVKSHEMELARLTDKYEKKLIGMQKKYQNDTDALKKQIAQLQRKLAPT